MSEECELCVKRKTMYCPNSSKCYSTEEKPFYQNRIMLLQENQQLKEDIKQLWNVLNSNDITCTSDEMEVFDKWYTIFKEGKNE